MYATIPISPYFMFFNLFHPPPPMMPSILPIDKKHFLPLLTERGYLNVPYLSHPFTPNPATFSMMTGGDNMLNIFLIKNILCKPV